MLNFKLFAAINRELARLQYPVVATWLMGVGLIVLGWQIYSFPDSVVITLLGGTSGALQYGSLCLLFGALIVMRPGFWLAPVFCLMFAPFIYNEYQRVSLLPDVQRSYTATLMVAGLFAVAMLATVWGRKWK